MPPPPPLPRPRILITRSRHQTSALAAQLEALGAEPILIPTIAIAPPETYAPLDAALAILPSFGWIVFTSANAVEAFHTRLNLPAVSRPAPQNPTTQTGHPPRIAAIGPATAQALQSIGLPADLIPPQAVAESLAEALLPHLTPHPTRILLIRAETARDTLPDTLRAAGADLTIAPAYRNLIPGDSIPLLHSLFRTPSTWPDAITFTSSSTASNLLALLEAAHLRLPPDGAPTATPSQTPNRTPAHHPAKTILRASIGPITSQTLRDLGYPPHLEAPEPNIPSLVQVLATHFHLRTR